MKRLAIAMSALVLSACGPNPNMPMHEQTDSAKAVGINTNLRFRVERVGVFRDDLAYDAKRGIYVITDTKTGKEFVGISGVGISELGSHSSGKSRVSDER